MLNLWEETSVPFHAQDDLLNSSTRISQVPNFRQEIRQSHYRNDPVKNDLVCSACWLLINSEFRCTSFGEPSEPDPVNAGIMM